MKMKSESRKWLVGLCLVLIFSFFTGYYLSYRINHKEKSKLEIIQEIMENEWYYGKDDENIEETLQTNMILGMMNMEKDPFTRYLTSLGVLADSFEGIGISIGIYGEYFIIDEVNSIRAIENGIRKGDILTKVNDIDLSNKTLQEVNAIFSDCQGEIVLTLYRNNEEMVITTSIVEYTPITVFTKEYGNDISYVKITEFNLDTAEKIEDYFKGLSNDYSNLVLDLRDNPGGYISAVQEVLDLFVPSNKIVMTTIDKNGNQTIVKTTNDSLYFFEKIIVLIDENSASGAEALAAAMDYHLDDIVTLYGDTTYGKGSAQKTHYFNDGTYFHYTYALWYTPEGKTINKIGVDPEIEDINTGISMITSITKEAKLYDYGTHVLGLQVLLDKLGYEVTLHSFVDELMVEAIKKYQQDYGLEVNGNVDIVTLRGMIKLIYDDKQDHLNNQLNKVMESLANGTI